MHWQPVEETSSRPYSQLVQPSDSARDFSVLSSHLAQIRQQS